MNNNDKPVGSFFAWLPVKPASNVEVTLIAPENLLDFGTKTIEVATGSKLSADSAGEDYHLTEFYTDEAHSNAFDYQNTPIASPMTLYVDGNPMTISANKATRLNNQEANITEAHFVLAGGEPSGTPTSTWDASDGVGAVTAKMYDGGKTYFVARQGATHIWCPDATNLLSNCPNLTKVDGFANLYGIKNLSYALYTDPAITNLGDIGQLDTSKVVAMERTFQLSAIPTNLNLSGWDTSNCLDFNRTFAAIASPSNLNVSNWVIPEGAYVFQTFLGLDKSKTGLRSINASNWDIQASDINAQYLFAQQEMLQSINVSGWDFSKLTSFRQFCYQDYELQEFILGEGNSLNASNFTQVDAFSGFYHMFEKCYKLCKFNNTTDEAENHTLHFRIPNVADMNNTQGFWYLGLMAESPFYIDIDLADSVYEEAGQSNIELVTPLTIFCQQCGATQIKAFGNYNDKWAGSTLGNTHTNIVTGKEGTNLNFIGGYADAVVDGENYSAKLESIIIDRFIPAGTVFGNNFPGSLEWILVNPDLTKEQAAFVLLNEQVATNTLLRGYYDGGVYEAKNRFSYGLGMAVATPTQRGYLTGNASYINPAETEAELESKTLAELKAAIDTGNLSDFPIGMEIEDQYDGESNPLVIAQILDETNNEAYGGAEGVILMRKYLQPDSKVYGPNGKYNESTIAPYLNDEYLSACSTELQSVVSDITIQYGDYQATPLGTMTTKVFLPSYDEIVATINGKGSGSLWDYWKFSGGSNVVHIAYAIDGAAKTWWTRSRTSQYQVRGFDRNGSIISPTTTSAAGVRASFFVGKSTNTEA